MSAELSPTRSAVDDETRARWVSQYGAAAAATIEQAHLAAEEARRNVIPPNTQETYDKGWRVWQRFCREYSLPELHGDQGTLTMFVVWMYERGRLDGKGMAPTSVQSHLTAAVVRLREQGAEVTPEAAAFARDVASGHAITLAKAGDIRGRGQAPAADLDGLRQIAQSTPDTLTGRRDLALVLTSFHYAGRASEPAGLLTRDVEGSPEGIVVHVRSGKTKHSVRDAAIPYAKDPLVCPVRAWHRWREALVTECGEQYADPAGPAFRAIDRWGHVGGKMAPDSITAAVTRIAKRSGVPIKWTGHSLRSGLATEARKNGKDAKVISQQGGWAPDSRAMFGYMRRADQWSDNASAGLA